MALVAHALDLNVYNKQFQSPTKHIKKMDAKKLNINKIKELFFDLQRNNQLNEQFFDIFSTFYFLLGDDSIKFKNGPYRNQLVRDVLIKDFEYCKDWEDKFMSRVEFMGGFKDQNEKIKHTYFLISRYRMIIHSEF